MSYQWNVKTIVKRSLSLSLVLLTTFIAANAHAEKVVFEDVSFLYGTSGKNNSFSITEAGTYQATLVDFGFPTPFDSIGMNITQGATLEVGRMFDAGTMIFDATRGTYFANVFGVADPGNTIDVSLYGLKISQLSVSAVPLPTAVGLFASALLLFAGFGNAGSRLGKVNKQELESAGTPAFA